MTDFKPINTQEEFNEAIKERVSRVSEKYADYEQIKKKNIDFETQLSDLTKQLNDLTTEKTSHEKVVAELNSKIQGYETSSLKTRVALELGLPFEFASRLTGDSEESIRKDAESLSKFVGKKQTAPIAATEPAQVDDKTAALKSLLQNIKEKN